MVVKWEPTEEVIFVSTGHVLRVQETLGAIIISRAAIQYLTKRKMYICICRKYMISYLFKKNVNLMDFQRCFWNGVSKHKII